MEIQPFISLGFGTVSFIILVTIWAYYAQRGVPSPLYAAIRIFDLAFVGSLIFWAATIIGYWAGNTLGSWIGLVSGILFASVPIFRRFGNLTKVRRSGWFAVQIWLFYWLVWITGYLVGGGVGAHLLALFVIAFTATVLYHTALYILPLRDPNSRQERWQAVRSMLTLYMNTNYPYYFVDENNQVETRVAGNTFQQFFGGPGLVYTNSNHAVLISNDMAGNRVELPGLNFTQRMEQPGQPPRIVDLRPQLRPLSVEALTQDGFTVKVFVFMPFRIDNEGKAFEIGQIFPHKKQAVYQTLLFNEVVGSDKNTSYTWDGNEKDGLVPLIVTRAAQTVISNYKMDELCFANTPGVNNRSKIADEIKKTVTTELKQYGLVVIGGGIANLEPTDTDIKETRFKQWQTNWQVNIRIEKSTNEAYRQDITGGAKTRAETKITQYFSKHIKEHHRQSPQLQRTIILRFIKSLAQMISQSNVDDDDD